MAETPFGSLDKEGNMISRPFGEPMAYGRFFVNPDEFETFKKFGWRKIRTVDTSMIVIERQPHDLMILKEEEDIDAVARLQQTKRRPRAKHPAIHVQAARKRRPKQL